MELLRPSDAATNLDVVPGSSWGTLAVYSMHQFQPHNSLNLMLDCTLTRLSEKPDLCRNLTKCRFVYRTHVWKTLTVVSFGFKALHCHIFPTATDVLVPPTRTCLQYPSTATFCSLLNFQRWSQVMGQVVFLGSNCSRAFSTRTKQCWISDHDDWMMIGWFFSLERLWDYDVLRV